jgi:hypothetical protein
LKKRSEEVAKPGAEPPPSASEEPRREATREAPASKATPDEAAKPAKQVRRKSKIASWRMRHVDQRALRSDEMIPAVDAARTRAAELTGTRAVAL